MSVYTDPSDSCGWVTLPTWGKKREKQEPLETERLLRNGNNTGQEEGGRKSFE